MNSNGLPAFDVNDTATWFDIPQRKAQVLYFLIRIGQLTKFIDRSRDLGRNGVPRASVFGWGSWSRPYRQVRDILCHNPYKSFNDITTPYPDDDYQTLIEAIIDCFECLDELLAVLSYVKI